MRRLIVLLALAGVGAAVWLYANRDQRSEHAKVLEAAHTALLERDTEALLGLMHEAEVRSIALTPAKLKRFLDEHVLADMDAMKLAEEVRFSDASPTNETASLSRTYANDRHRITFSIAARRKDGAVTLDSLIYSLYFGRAMIDLEGGLPSRERVRLLADTMDKDAEILTEMGIPGVLLMNADRNEFRTWTEFAENRRAALERYAD